MKVLSAKYPQITGLFWNLVDVLENVIKMFMIFRGLEQIPNFENKQRSKKKIDEERRKSKQRNSKKKWNVKIEQKP